MSFRRQQTSNGGRIAHIGIRRHCGPYGSCTDGGANHCGPLVAGTPASTTVTGTTTAIDGHEDDQYDGDGNKSCDHPLLGLHSVHSSPIRRQPVSAAPHITTCRADVRFGRGRHSPHSIKRVAGSGRSENAEAARHTAACGRSGNDGSRSSVHDVPKGTNALTGLPERDFSRKRNLDPGPVAEEVRRFSPREVEAWQCWLFDLDASPGPAIRRQGSLGEHVSDFVQER